MNLLGMNLKMLKHAQAVGAIGPWPWRKWKFTQYDADWNEEISANGPMLSTATVYACILLYADIAICQSFYTELFCGSCWKKVGHT